MQTTNPRTSVLNRTMIVSKRSRRPGLPEVDSSNNENSLPGENISVADIKLPNSARIAPRNHYRRDTVTFEADQSALGPPSIQIPPSATTDAISQHDLPSPSSVISLSDSVKKAFDDVDQVSGLSATQKFSESRTRILTLIQAKEREWKSYVEKQEKDRLLKTQICDLKLSVANRTSEKAEMFCKICEDCGIDFERILRKESNAIHRLKADAVNEMGRQPESPESEAELARLIRERDSLSDEIRSLEGNYSNLFKLYEKMRENCLQLKAAEEGLKNDASEQTKKYNSLYALYNELLNDVQEKLINADVEVKRIQKESADKTLGIRMALKRAKIQIESLEVALESKVKENEELNKICNELLSKRENAMMTSSIMESDESPR